MYIFHPPPPLVGWFRGNYDDLLGKPQKKSSVLSGPATKEGWGWGGGVKALPLRKKDFFLNVRKKVPMATKPRWAKGFSGRSTKKRTFFRGFPKE